MFTGAHILLYSTKPEADRAFFRDVLGLRSVDAGGGWLIFALPPAEAALHPVESVESTHHGERGLMGAVLYFMCKDLKAAMRRLRAKKVHLSRVMRAPWGMKTSFRLPSGGEIGLYQPRHPTALGLGRAKR
jgi:catechol 2,3-dioxygenase-like lactoylglutathione lyase family enzyme